MIVLALDTAVTGCSACLMNGQESFTERLDTERGQAELLVPFIDGIMRKSGLSYAQIDRIAVTVGPGSFTGVRIGLSTAKALALSLNKSLVGFTTLEVIAREGNFTKDTLVLIDTKRGDFYGQVFGIGCKTVTEPEIWTEEKIQAIGLETVMNAIPDSEVMAQMAAEMSFAKDGYDALTAPEPVYLRGAEVSQSKRIAPTINSD